MNEAATVADNPTKTEIQYREHPLQEVLRYFVNGYKLQEGEIFSHEAFVDTAKGKVVLKLFVKTPL